ncbi:hypothetical protein [Streptomyces sp. RB17]|uniref:hypothetical protein n=1 Tax=Streptomyces sp. RB17 TaxID=2585197 RepID=UPI001296AAF5|nr:hypothetical protein [Streptomyces sp. RB17]
MVEPHDFHRLHVEVTGLDATAASAALADAGLGRMDASGRAWLATRSLRALAEPFGAPPEWAEQWDAMLTYAAAKGWVRGGSIRAHVVGV